MNPKRIIITIVLLAIILQTASADTIYNIDDVRNLEAIIHIDEVTENQYLQSEIDSRNIEEEANSGGYLGDGDYLLPHDLGLGRHTLEITIYDEWAEIVKTQTITFYIVKAEEDTSIYDDYSPYYYEEINDEQIIEDYQDYITSQTLTTNDNEEMEPVENPTVSLIKVKVNIGTIQETIDETLTSVKL